MRLRIEAANTALSVVDGRIADASAAVDHVIRISRGMLRPGLINAHDHLHRNHYGRLGNPPYANAYAWAADIQSRHKAAIAEGRGLPRRQALLAGAWKNLMAGVTHVVHHDPWQEAFAHGFPLSVVHLACIDSLGMTPAFTAPADTPFALHLAEGVDAAAAEEVRALAARGLLNENLVAVHCVGADADGIARLRGSGGAMVWCPSSNRFLFGGTAPAALLAEGMDVLLGTDSLLTGEGDLLDELRVARSLGLMTDGRLLDAVGTMAARRLGITCGLSAGAEANLAVFTKPLLEATPADVVLVIAGGMLRVLDPALLPADLSHGCIVQRNGVERWISEG